MARPLRIEYPGAFYHITNRGVGKQNIFFKDYGRKVFLEKLGDLHEKWGIIFHDLRHCFASHLVMAGVDLVSVKGVTWSQIIDHEVLTSVAWT